MWTDQANELISWLWSKSAILSKLPYTVIRPGLTRWSAYLVSYRRLLLICAMLRCLAVMEKLLPPEEQIMVTGDAKAKAKAEAMVKTIETPRFWHSIAR